MSMNFSGLQIEALTLKERHFQAYQRLSLSNASSWIRYANDGRKTWVAARALQQEIDELKGKLKMAILQAKKDRVRAARAPNGQDGDEVSSANSSGPPDSIV
ncbi:uncharacterized protein EV420DRAFT_1633620 [Desarmillaria tabescens]|uniref:Uncharacterized protein n=1 Tax=Armillaria tabescens TaxID=1929756 RepID=A0AA39NP17_ARMTA|nr:uncharacterized protein EV420DRAFT_1633620 [Desarmillaria tabescens]KAK0469195.1 hypothetical protein EV420DRAFT_1633620 [Desarmillaria tabescens]